MAATYTGILRNNSIEWSPPAPELPADGVRVQVTVLDALPVPEQGQRMAAALDRLAAARALDGIGDPLAWERETRQERELPDRD